MTRDDILKAVFTGAVGVLDQAADDVARHGISLTDEIVKGLANVRPVAEPPVDPGKEPPVDRPPVVPPQGPTASFENFRTGEPPEVSGGLDGPVKELYEWIWENRGQILRGEIPGVEEVDPIDAKKIAWANPSHRYSRGGALSAVWEWFGDHAGVFEGPGRTFYLAVEDATDYELFRYRIARPFRNVRWSKTMDSGRPFAFASADSGLGVLFQALRKYGAFKRWEGKS